MFRAAAFKNMWTQRETARGREGVMVVASDPVDKARHCLRGRRALSLRDRPTTMCARAFHIYVRVCVRARVCVCV